MTHGVCELLWIKNVFDDLGIKWETINIAHNLVQYDRTKHVKVDRHFIEKNSIVV